MRFEQREKRAELPMDWSNLPRLTPDIATSCQSSFIFELRYSSFLKAFVV
jgi:hypothetical protein